MRVSDIDGSTFPTADDLTLAVGAILGWPSRVMSGDPRNVEEMCQYAFFGAPELEPPFTIQIHNPNAVTSAAADVMQMQWEISRVERVKLDGKNIDASLVVVKD